MIHELFPTKLYSAALVNSRSKLISDLVNESLKIQEIDLDGKVWSKKNYHFGYTSYGSMDQLHRFSSTFDELKKKIDPHVKKYMTHLDWDFAFKDIFLSKLWINIMPQGCIHTGHIHPLSVISGTFYIQVPTKKIPCLKFEDPRFGFFMARPTIKNKSHPSNKPFFNFEPKPGHLVLFESWLRHEVMQNTNDSDRISISFNYDRR